MRQMRFLIPRTQPGMGQYAVPMNRKDGIMVPAAVTAGVGVGGPAGNRAGTAAEVATHPRDHRPNLPRSPHSTATPPASVSPASTRLSKASRSTRHRRTLSTPRSIRRRHCDEPRGVGDPLSRPPLLAQPRRLAASHENYVSSQLAGIIAHIEITEKHVISSLV